MQNLDQLFILLFNRSGGVYIPDIKECRFFSQMPTNMLGDDFQNKGISCSNAYKKLFGHVDKETLCGNISNDYIFYYKKSIKNILREYKNNKQKLLKILIIIRNPYKRVFSIYHHWYKEHYLNDDFCCFFGKSDHYKKKRYAWTYQLQELGMTFNAVKAYIENFPRVKILLFDNINDKFFYDEIKNFLNIDNNIYAKKENINFYFKQGSLLKKNIYIFKN